MEKALSIGLVWYKGKECGKNLSVSGQADDTSKMLSRRKKV